ncbi:unnamed protein product [Brugia pahangi]|uniref:NR LBD domain-containing protein n=1 Tax=Brugia pahangi TaxID=6280 RepID=A0A0N4TXZ8_BRUPA|nr:unnamed protein product [Brugia pahangi]
MKRKMISDNRERRKIEQLEAVLETNSLTDKQDEFQTRINQHEFKSDVRLERLLELTELVTQQIRQFAETIKIYDSLNHSAQEEIIEKSLLVLKVLHIIYEFIPTEHCLMLANNTTYIAIKADYSELDYTTKFFENLINLAASFHCMQLDNRQLALSSACLFKIRKM